MPIKFDIITLFPDIIKCYFKESLLKKAIENNIIKINFYNLRDFSDDKRKKVDDKPFGGGRGMVIKAEPVIKAITSLIRIKIVNKKIKPVRKKTRIILFSPRGKNFNQKIAFNFLKFDHFILICGRYEGIDERITKYVAIDIISIGDYVLMGGEIPALVFIETISRLIPGVVGKSELLLSERIVKNGAFLEYPQYTRPAILKLNEILKIKNKKVELSVPKILLSGNHKKIEEWRKKHQKIIE
ncbi:MAG: tRNA (guanosine(37)-N1)-methyltransferase TrmD [Minisyncoccia bacterium]